MKSKSVRTITRSILPCAFILAGPLLSCTTEPTAQQVQEWLVEYRQAIIAADTTSIRRLCSPVSTAQHGFWESMHIVIGNIGTLDEFRDFAQRYTPSVTEIESRGTYTIVYFDWMPLQGDPDTSASPIPMHYYFVHEGDQLVLINPIDILTQDWLHHEGDVCTFHYSPQAADGDEVSAMQRMDSLCSDLVKLFHAPDDFRTDVYVTPSGPECGELLLYPPAGAYACMQRNLVVTTSFINPHELVHLLSTGGKRGLFINAAFGEGLCVALGGTYFSRPEFAVAQARNIAASDKYIPISELLFLDDSSFLSNSQVCYQETGSFVKFLIDKYGLPMLKSLQECNEQTGDLGTCIGSTYSATVEKLEKQWYHFNDSASIPVVVSGDIPGTAELVASVIDPTGDDHGGGDYYYPTDSRFGDGCLDITRFEVRVDKETVYFQVEFRDLGKPVLDDSNGHTAVPGLTVGMKRGDGHLQRQYSGVRFADSSGIDLRLDIGLGIVVCDSYGQAVFSSGTIRDIISDYTDNTLTFGLPVELVGNPKADWGFFAGSMLVTDYGFGFLRSFPCPVESQPSAFRVGGASSPHASPFVDLVLPTGVEQIDLFKEYDPQRGKPLIVPLVSSVTR
ncbi:MAG TPA: glucodextranase DOMON-like domain-containing protein [Acidobacteriota bacterium]|nr:glucodextranase DOMON-like domain-containing protein [Acidobacteriota bacterium]